MIKRILHTSDWHIGRRLKTRERFDEFTKFFAWLENLITSEDIDMLLISGDIFDNTTPNAKSQELYYSFLAHIAVTKCRHVIIISGNHDSPALIDAPADVLKYCNVRVIGTACENPCDEVINLNDEAIVCAVPYLRDRDIRTLKSDDNQDIGQVLRDGIASHYAKVFARAEELRGEKDIPVIAMGHLFAKGGKVRYGEGVRSLYVGTAVDVHAEIFPEFVTYTALGHLHSPQKIGRGNIRYSGSPLAVTFSEFETQKSVYVIDLDGKNLTGINAINVPVFQKLKQIKGSTDEIFTALNQCAEQNESIWLEIIYTGTEIMGDMQERLNDYIKPYPFIEILSIIDESRIINEGGEIFTEHNTLENINPLEMFGLLLDNSNTDISIEQRKIYVTLYEKILHRLEIDY